MEPPPTDQDRTGLGPVIDWTTLLPQVVVNVHTYAASGTGSGGDRGRGMAQGCSDLNGRWVSTRPDGLASSAVGSLDLPAPTPRARASRPAAR
jgi:hypothetical protein